MKFITMLLLTGILIVVNCYALLYSKAAARDMYLLHYGAFLLFSIVLWFALIDSIRSIKGKKLKDENN